VDVADGGTLGADRTDLLSVDRLDAWCRTALGHGFGNIDLARRALTHGSAAGRAGQHYERLEFLGDRVLGFVIADWLYREFDEPEGRLAQRLAALVDTSTCAEVARAINVADVAVIDKAARQSGVAQSDNVLGDMCEALIGALYLDGGMTAAERFVGQQWARFVDRDQVAPKDPKSALQEWAQRQQLPVPAYELVGREGPDHAPKFHIRVTVRGYPPAEAVGTSKQDAEKLAAMLLLGRENAR